MPWSTSRRAPPPASAPMGPLQCVTRGCTPARQISGSASALASGGGNRGVALKPADDLVRHVAESDDALNTRVVGHVHVVLHLDVGCVHGTVEGGVVLERGGPI